MGVKADSFELDGGECFAMVSSKENPSILFIHGGPHTAYGNTYFIEFQYFYRMVTTYSSAILQEVQDTGRNMRRRA